MLKTMRMVRMGLAKRSVWTVGDVEKDWRWRTNYFKDWWNKSAYGQVVPGKVLSVADKVRQGGSKGPKRFSDSQEDESTAFWVGVADRGAEKRRRRRRREVVEREDSLEGAIASATLGLQERSLVPDLPGPAEGGSPKKPRKKKTTAKRSSTLLQKNLEEEEEDLLRVSHDNPSKPVLTAATAAATLDPEAVREERAALKRAAAEARAKRGEEGDRWPSVTHILNETMPQENRLALQIWEERMIRELGQDGFLRHRRALLRRGRRLHAFVEARLTGDAEAAEEAAAEAEEDGDPAALALLRSVEPRLRELSWPLALEAHVRHPTLKYQGIADAVAIWTPSTSRGRKGRDEDGELTLLDWKTSGRPRPTLSSTYDAPLQVAAYVGAANADPRHGFRVRSACVVVVHGFSSSSSSSVVPAVALRMDAAKLEDYWRRWLLRLATYRRMREYRRGKQGRGDN